MKLATSEQIAAIDRLADTKFGLSKNTLVGMAAKGLVRGFLEVLSRFELGSSHRWAAWCGPGSNGADGRAMVSLLNQQGFAIEIVEGTKWEPQNYDGVIDALFGVGLNRDLETPFQEKIQQLKTSRAKVFAVDIPSGLSANTGLVRGASVRAVATLTIYPPKPGLFLNQGPEHAGLIRSVDMKMPVELFKTPGLLDTFLVNRRWAEKNLPKRSSTANKTNFGHLLVIAGSPGMEGAAEMVSEAAARMGCGYVTICSRSPRLLARAKPDFLQLSLEDFFKSDLKKYSSVVVGPGLGLTAESTRIIETLLKLHARVLVDADGLTLLSQLGQRSLPKEWILTPHAGELARLLGEPAKALEADRLSAVRTAVNQWGANVLFKGFRTVLGAGAKNFVIYSGNVALAKAGSGDTLAGFIGSLMAQGLTTAKAGALGAYLHGRIADDWLRRGGSTRTLMASDLPILLDATLSRLKKPR